MCHLLRLSSAQVTEICCTLSKCCPMIMRTFFDDIIDFSWFVSACSSLAKLPLRLQCVLGRYCAASLETVASFTKLFKMVLLKKGCSGCWAFWGVHSRCYNRLDAGSLLVAGAPVGNPSTVVVWEVTAWDLNSPGSTQQVAAKIGIGNIQSPLLATPPSWPGFAPLAAYLFTWQEQATPDTMLEGEECPGPLLHCSVVSNFSAYVSPDAAAITSWGSGVTSVAFDPSRGGSALVTVIVEGTL